MRDLMRKVDRNCCLKVSSQLKAHKASREHTGNRESRVPTALPPAPETEPGTRGGGARAPGTPPRELPPRELPPPLLPATPTPPVLARRPPPALLLGPSRPLAGGATGPACPTTPTPPTPPTPPAPRRAMHEVQGAVMPRVACQQEGPLGMAPTRLVHLPNRVRTGRAGPDGTGPALAPAPAPTSASGPGSKALGGAGRRGPACAFRVLAAALGGTMWSFWCVWKGGGVAWKGKGQKREVAMCMRVCMLCVCA
jgi:hypothetical protein